jgi:outer membrane protein OmpA-like peptidoglycan-associated protein
MNQVIVRFGSAVFSVLFSQAAAAQAEASAPAPAPAPASANASASGSVSLGGGADASADASAAADDDAKYEAEDGQFELGLMAGLLVPSKDHNLRNELAPHYEYSLAPQIGIRAGFLPIKYLGAEFEGTWALSSDDSDDSVRLFAARGHLIGQLPIGRITPFLVFGAGAMGAGSSSQGNDTDPALHFGIGAKYALSQAVGLRLDVLDSMHQKFNAEQDTLTHSPEVTLSVTFALHPRHERDVVVAASDADGDGFLDARDQCPNEAGISPDGCPDKDSDGDTVFDSKDACPAEPGPAASCGCGVKDTDKDGVPDNLDKCPNEPGTINGCPDLDPDHDGVNVPADKCPDKPETKNGFDDDDGCPDEVPERIKKFTGIIKGIEFDTGKDTIRPVSEPVLENALLVLNEYPKTRIEISGHSDDVGKREDNIDLSKRRADSVKQWFVGKGIDARRIETRGVGPDEPIADNKTPAGKQKNRRIEFKLLQSAEAKPAGAIK